MRIRQKIALFYTGITFFILFSVFGFVYVMTYNNVNDNFFSVLREKAVTFAQMNFAQKNFKKGELNKQDYNKILKNYNRNRQPGDVEVVYNVNDSIDILKLRKILSKEKITELHKKKRIEFTKNDLLGVGIFYEDKDGDFIVITMAENKQGEQMLDNLFKTLLIVLLISEVFVYFIGFFYAAQILNPLVDILKKVNHIRAGNLEMRLIERKGNDELSRLIRMLNQMIERLDATFKSQKSFIANASHELNNPLSAILGEIEITLDRNRSEEEYKKTLERIEEEAERIKTLTQDLLNLAQTDLDISADNLHPVNLIELLHEIRTLYDKTEYENRIVVVPEQSIDFCIPTGNAHLLKIALKNILDNACKYSENNTQVVVSLSKEDNQILLSIKDKGIGISEEDLSGIFQPFFRGKNTFSRKGHGIGLPLADKIISHHRGKIQLTSRLNEGTEVTVCFDLTGEE